MTKPRTLARVGLGGVVLAESMAAWSRWERRRDLFLAAAARARATRRRLIVVLPDKEGPIARALRVYEFGRHYPEVFLASPSPVVRARDLQRAPLADVPGDSAVLYVAEVLEYVPDLRAVMDELLRMAGTTDNLFVVTVQPWTLTAALHPRARWAGLADTHVVSMGPITPLHRGFAAGVLLGLAAISAMPPAREPEPAPERPGPPTRRGPAK